MAPGRTNNEMRNTIFLSTTLLGLAMLLNGLWIPAKAALAQKLIERAWQQSLEQTEKVRPWPWADTHPVAVLSSSRLNERLFVLEGATGRTLAFGPGNWTPGARAGQIGNRVFVGHRDTHFRFLKHLQPGDTLTLETHQAPEKRFRVDELSIVDKYETWPLRKSNKDKLTLITCYPFDAVVPGGPLRYVVEANFIPFEEEVEEVPGRED